MNFNFIKLIDLLDEQDMNIVPTNANFQIQRLYDKVNVLSYHTALFPNKLTLSELGKASFLKDAMVLIRLSTADCKNLLRKHPEFEEFLQNSVSAFVVNYTHVVHKPNMHPAFKGLPFY